MCTSILAGKSATEYNLILLSRNEDFTRNNWNKYMVVRKTPEYLPAEGNPTVSDGQWTLGNGVRVAVPGRAYRYSAMPDAQAFEEAPFNIGQRFFFEERGINERNVALSATNSMASNDRVKALDPYVTSGIVEQIIPTLILPQADSARHAVDLLGGYVDSVGAGEPNGVLIGDAEEVWYFEIGSAHHWIAVRIPDDSYMAVANGLRVHGVDLDSDDVVHSAGLLEFVRDNKLLDHPDPASFNFANAFGLIGIDYNVDRIWLAQKMLTPSLTQAPRQSQYPMFLKPDRPIAVGDVMAILRATYRGTELAGKAPRPIGFDKTAESHILTIDPAMPAPLRGMIWQSVSTPLGSPYLPLYNAMTEVPHCFSIGNNQFGTSSAYWAFRSLFTLGNMDDEEFLESIQSTWREFEQQSMRQVRMMAPWLCQAYDSDADTAVDFACRYSTGVSLQAVEMATQSRNQLMTTFTEQVGQAHQTHMSG